MSAPPIPGIERILFTEEQIDAAHPRSGGGDLATLYRGKTAEADRRAERLGVFPDGAGAPHRDSGQDRLPGRFPVSPTRAARPAWCASPKIWTRASRAKTCCWWKTLSIPASRCATCCRRWPAARRIRSSVCTFLDRNSRRIVQVPGGLPLLRDSRPLRGGLRAGLQPALPQPGVRGGDEARKGMTSVDGGSSSPTTLSAAKRKKYRYSWQA